MLLNGIIVAMTRRIDISWKTIIFISVFLLSIWIIYQILALILLLLVAIIFMSALSPAVNLLTSKLKLPKALAVLLIYILIIVIVVSTFTVAFTPLIEQTTHLLATLPSVISNLIKVSNIDSSVFPTELTNFSRNIVPVTLKIFDTLVAAVLILVLTFYLILERVNLENRLAGLFGDKEKRIRELLADIEYKLGAWLRGQIILSLLVGASVFLGLTVLQIPFALPLAIIAALFEVIPMIGPILSAIPAIILALAISPVLAGGVAALYFVIQQLESHLIIPQVMKKAVGLNPLIVILAISVGGRLLGIGGALLAVPIAVVVQVIISDILRARED